MIYNIHIAIKVEVSANYRLSLGVIMMRKIFFMTSILFLPLSAYGQTEVSNATIQSAANELKPALCKNDLKQAIQIVEDCYAKVDEDSEKYNMNQCVTEDMFVLSVIKYKQKQYMSNSQIDPYANLEFANINNAGVRWLKHPSFINRVTDSQDAQKIGYQVTKDVINILKQENCWNLDKLK